MTSLSNMIWQAKCMLKKNWLMAVNILEEAISIYPEEKEPLYELAEIYSKYDKSREAINIYEKILKLDRNDDYTRFKIANNYLALNEPKLAIVYFNEIKEPFPESEYNKAIAYQRLGQDKETISILKEIVNKKYDNDLPYIFLAEQYIKIHEFEKAIEVLNLIISISAETGAILFYKGLCYSYLNNNIKAYVSFQKAEKLNYQSSNFYHAFGISCEKIGKTDEAIEYIEKAISLFPDSSIAYLDLIKILIKNGQFNKAQEVIEKLKVVSHASAVLAENMIKSFHNEE